MLDESVNEEWSFLETLRHLVFATDRWITGPVLRDANLFHPLGMPNPPLDEVAAGVFDLEAKPTFDEVVAVRRERMDRVAEHLKGIDPERRAVRWLHDRRGARDLLEAERVARAVDLHPVVRASQLDNG